MDEAAPQHEGRYDKNREGHQDGHSGGHSDGHADGSSDSRPAGHRDKPPGGPGDRPDQRAHRRAQQVAAALRVAAAAVHRGTSSHDRVDGNDSTDSADLADLLCLAAVGELDAQGATLCALFAPGMSVPIGVSDPTAARAEELQFTAGEGPCWQALRTSEVVVSDLVDPAGAVHLSRLWPAYTSAVRRETGYAAVVAVPFVLGSGLQLVLTVYAASLHPDRWWQAAPVVTGALRQVLDVASPPMARGGSGVAGLLGHAAPGSGVGS